MVRATVELLGKALSYEHASRIEVVGRDRYRVRVVFRMYFGIGERYDAGYGVRCVSVARRRPAQGIIDGE